MSYLASNSPHLLASVPRISICRNPLIVLALLAGLVATISQSGSVPSGNLNASQTNLNFGNVAIGSSRRQSLTLTNSGPAAFMLNKTVTFEGSQGTHYLTLMMLRSGGGAGGLFGLVPFKEIGTI